MEALSPAVQVVTTGTDWPAIVAAISTGMVGIAGIGGTLWSSRRRVSAEDARARLAQKRQIYADCLTAFAEMATAATDHRNEFSAADRDPERRRFTESRVDKARDAMYQAVNIVLVGAPDNVAKLAEQLTTAFTDYVGATRKGTPKDSPAAADVGNLHASVRQAIRTERQSTWSTAQMSRSMSR